MLRIAVVLSWLLAVPVLAQAPALSEVQGLRVQVLVQRLELAQLRAQAAQRDFDEARAALAALAKELEVPGYTLDLSTRTYAPKPEGTP